MNIIVNAAGNVEQVMVKVYRSTEPLTGNRTRQIYDIKNCPGLIVVRDGYHVGDHFEVEDTQYQVQATGRYFTDAAEALLAWDDAKGERELLDALAHSLRRYRMGVVRPLWEDTPPADKAKWIGNAKIFRDTMIRLGIDIKKREVAPL